MNAIPTNALIQALELIKGDIDRNTSTYPQRPPQTVSGGEKAILDAFVQTLSAGELETLASLTDARIKDLAYSKNKGVYEI